MTKILGENSNRDLFIGSNNQLVVFTDLDAVAQACKSAIEAQRREMQFATQDGIPTEQTLWNGIANQQQFQFFCRQRLLKVEGVTAVLVFDTEIQDNTLIYNATISTIFGEVNISASI